MVNTRITISNIAFRDKMLYRKARLQALKHYFTSVGFFAGQSNIDGVPFTQIARDNEYGVPSRRVPARPFMAVTMRTSGNAMRGMMLEGAMRYLDRSTTAYDVMVRVGIAYTNAIQRSIASNMPPPNAASTVRIKGFNKTLMHTGQLFKAVSYRVGVSVR